MGRVFYVLGYHPMDCLDDFFKTGPSAIVQDILPRLDDVGLFLHNKRIPVLHLLFEGLLGH